MANERKTMLRKTIVFILLFMAGQNIFLHAAGDEDRTIKLKEQTASLQAIFDQVEQQTGLITMFNNDIVDAKKVVTIGKKEIPLGELYTSILSGTELNYEIKGKYIVIVPKKETPPPAVAVEYYSGNVVDLNNEPLIGVTIICVEGGRGQGVTNADGNYRIAIIKEGDNLHKGHITLRFTYVGMLQHNEKILETAKKETTYVVMLEDSKFLDEVVVTGYQTVSRRDMVGAVTTVQAKDIITPNYSSIDQMLQGVVPGMIVTSTSARAGTTPSIKIRGTSTILGDTEPLWVVDGIIQEEPLSIPSASLLANDMKEIIGNQISWLNPHDIESITVLKDASATAIYGSKASNGVIVITTTFAKETKERISVNYSGSVSVGEKPNYGMFNLMNSQERVRFSDDAFASGIPYSSTPWTDINSYDGVKRMFIDGSITAEEQMKRRAYLETINTNWFDLLTRNSVNNTHNVRVAGGTGKIRFTSSVGYTKQDAQEIGNSSERLTGRVATIFNLSEKLKINVSIVGSNTRNRGFGSGVNPYSYAVSTSRAIPAYDEDGSLSYYQRRNNYTYNNIATLGYNIINERNNSSTQTENIRLSASAEITWNILKGLN